VVVSGLDTNQSYDFYVYECMETSASIHFARPGVATSGGTLPVELLSFNGAMQKEKVLLNWSTASEINNNGFYVERSADGKNFEAAGFVKGAGNTVTEHAYSFTDAAAWKNHAQQTVYYRLKQEDFDGRIQYSRVAKVNRTNDLLSECTAYPNPFNDKVTLMLSSKEERNVEVIITDLYGKTVMSKQVKLVQGDNSVLIEESANLANGFYLLNIAAGEEVQHIKILKTTNNK